MGLVRQGMAPPPAQTPPPPPSTKAIFDGIHDLTAQHIQFVDKPWRQGVNPQTLIPSAAHALALVTSGSV